MNIDALHAEFDSLSARVSALEALARPPEPKADAGLLPIGTRVVDQHGLTGAIKYYELIPPSGKPSVWPYFVTWDDMAAALAIRGNLYAWPLQEELTVISAEQQLSPAHDARAE